MPNGTTVVLEGNLSRSDWRVWFSGRDEGDRVVTDRLEEVVQKALAADQAQILRTGLPVQARITIEVVPLDRVADK